MKYKLFLIFILLILSVNFASATPSTDRDDYHLLDNLNDNTSFHGNYGLNMMNWSATDGWGVSGGYDGYSNTNNKFSNLTFNSTCSLIGNNSCTIEFSLRPADFIASNQCWDGLHITILNSSNKIITDLVNYHTGGTSSAVGLTIDSAGSYVVGNWRYMENLKYSNVTLQFFGGNDSIRYYVNNTFVSTVSFLRGTDNINVIQIAGNTPASAPCASTRGRAVYDNLVVYNTTTKPEASVATPSGITLLSPANATSTIDTLFNFTFNVTTTDATLGKSELYINGVLNSTLGSTIKDANNTFTNIQLSRGIKLWNVKVCGSDNTTCAWASNGNFTLKINDVPNILSRYYYNVTINTTINYTSEGGQACGYYNLSGTNKWITCNGTDLTPTIKVQLDDNATVRMNNVAGNYTDMNSTMDCTTSLLGSLYEATCTLYTALGSIGDTKQVWLAWCDTTETLCEDSKTWTIT
jgi:hypothetical protein